MMRRSTSSTSLDNSSLSAVSVFGLDFLVVRFNFVTAGNAILQGVILSAFCANQEHTHCEEQYLHLKPNKGKHLNSV